MALVSTHTIPRILDLLSVGKLETAAMMVTHGKLTVGKTKRKPQLAATI